MTENKRPLSPHLFIYKFEITMVMSFMHRVTGAGLFFGTLLIAWWLVAAAIGDPALAIVNFVAGTWLGQLVLFAMVWALFHHMLGGLRHFVWDFGAGFSEGFRYGSAWATLVGGFVLALVTFVVFVWM